MPKFDLNGRIALVTGASSGIGAHLAKTLATAGCTVGIAARRANRLEVLSREICDAGGTVVPLVMDVTDRDAIAAGINRLEAEGGIINILVNNAGMASAHGFLNAPQDETDRVFGVNQQAVWDVAQLVSQRLVQTGKPGSIINISSITGLRSIGGAASYAVSKAAVAHMTRIQALELARYKIRVNAIAPGYFDTELTHDFLSSDAGARLTRRIPMKRTGQLNELDGPLLLLASELGSFITGVVIPVDGGHLLSSL